MVLGKHPLMDFFWLKVRELDFGEPFLSDVKQDCCVMGGEDGFFSACYFFCYLCLWVNSFQVSTAMWTWWRHVIMWFADFPYIEFGSIEQSACVQLSASGK
jgi:hypothetical protein